MTIRRVVIEFRIALATQEGIFSVTATDSVNRRLAGPLALAAASMLLLSGCGALSGGSGDSSEPVSDTPSPGPSTPSTTPAPTVDNPVDTSALSDDPCAVLTDEQATSFNLEPGSEESMGNGDPVCRYRYADGSGSRVSFLGVPDFTNGLADVYARADALAVFEPVEVADHPAVITQTHQDDRADGFCDVQVGLTDEVVVSLMVQISDTSDDYPRGCEVGKVLSEAMINNLR